MKITKIKKYLAKLGIGNPFNTLLYDDEIEELSQRPIKKPKKSLEQKFIEKHKGEYAIKTSGIIVNKTFYTKENALRWAEWNYKGKGSWEIIKL